MEVGGKKREIEPCLIFFGSYLKKTFIDFQKIWAVCKALEIIFQMQRSPSFYLNSLKSYKGKYELFTFWKRWWNANCCLTYYNPCSHKNSLVLCNFLLFPTSSQSRMGVLHTHGHRSLHTSPKTTRYTPKVAVFCFFRLLMQTFDPPIIISLCWAVFCSVLPHLTLGGAYCPPTAIEAPMAAPKQPEIPLRLLHFALSAFWC